MSLDPNSYIYFGNRILDTSRKIIQKVFFQYYQTNSLSLEIEKKIDGTEVSSLDKEVEQILSRKIQKKFPHHKVIGEEYGLQEAKENSKFTWFIDPIDGTKSLLSGDPTFGTLLALTYEDKIIAGWVDMPLLEQRYWGWNTGAKYLWKKSKPQDLQTRSCLSLSNAILRTTSPDLFSQEKAPFLNLLQKKINYSIYGGDCFSYMQLSNGLLDIVFESGLAIHDFLALIPIIKGAGGKISNWQGKNLELFPLEKKRDILALGDSRLLSSILACLASS